ncbi:glycosyltransferase family 2 protein [Desulfonema magnum]|uniref:Glycosyltransferase n=1 Tax=Desulfonema magnum TaxID=45655 RepID=A0A975BU53_9BACT|nr:glycosyltransferase family 2 protein [Desulfonema magnum]QTA91880.1 Glycosyltransferase [Desulfonema magnum]
MIEILFWLFIFSILYTYFGYPALLALLARTRPEPKPYPLTTPSVTLLIPAYNEQAVIAQKIENSLALDYPPRQFQILVVNDGSEDRTAEIVRQYADACVELSHNDIRGGKMAAIQQAMALARGEIIVLTDATNFFERDAIHELVAPFADPDVGVVTGTKSILRGDGALGESEGLYWRYESFILRQETRLGCCTAATGDSMAIRRDLFEAPSHKAIGAIDFHLAMGIIRRGYRVIYASKVPSYERVSVSAKHEMERRSRIIAGRFQAIFMAWKILPLRRPLLVWQIVSHKFMRPLVPLFMIGALLTNLMLAARSDTLLIYQVLMIFQCAFYIMAVIGNGIERKNTMGKLLYLPTFLVNSNIAALVGLWRFLRGRQTPLWKRVPRREEETLKYDKK